MPSRRIYAQDPRADYLPSVGMVQHFDVGAGVRVDAAFDSAGEVSAHYDAMIAKVIAHAPTREQASRLLAGALRRTSLVGIDHNIALLVRTLGHDDFALGRDTDLLERAGPAELGRPLVRGDDLAVSLLAVALVSQALRRGHSIVTPAVSSSFRNVPTAPQTVNFAFGGTERRVDYLFERGRLVHASVDGAPLDGVERFAADPNAVHLLVAGIRRRYELTQLDGAVALRSSAGVVTAVPGPRCSASSGQRWPAGRRCSGVAWVRDRRSRPVLRD